MKREKENDEIEWRRCARRDCLNCQLSKVCPDDIVRCGKTGSVTEGKRPTQLVGRSTSESRQTCARPHRHNKDIGEGDVTSKGTRFDARRRGSSRTYTQNGRRELYQSYETEEALSKRSIRAQNGRTAFHIWPPQSTPMMAPYCIRRKNRHTTDRLFLSPNLSPSRSHSCRK